jgi:hypothetical protein
LIDWPPWIGAPSGDDEELAGELAQEQAEEPHHLGAVIGRGLRLHHQALVCRDGRDGRAMAAR